MPGETGFAKAASSQASITIGWFWDNHHSYTANSRLAELVDIAIPSHHYGCETLTAVQARVTRPLPLATSQWSVPTLESFADILNKRTMRHMLVGRFSEWSVSPERAEVVGLLDEYFGGDPQYDFNVSPASSMAFLHSSALNNAIDWNSSLSSLVLGVRRDLSMRFFDSMLCGCVPIVDCEVSGRALDDLKPGILEHQHYLVCNARDPRQLLEAVKDSVELAESNYGTDLRSFLLRHHMLESRLGLLIHAALAACGAVTPPLSYWNG